MLAGAVEIKMMSYPDRDPISRIGDISSAVAQQVVPAYDKIWGRVKKNAQPQDLGGGASVIAGNR